MLIPERSVMRDHKNLFKIALKHFQRCDCLYMDAYDMHALIKKL